MILNMFSYIYQHIKEDRPGAQWRQSAAIRKRDLLIGKRDLLTRDLGRNEDNLQLWTRDHHEPARRLGWFSS